MAVFRLMKHVMFVIWGTDLVGWGVINLLFLLYITKETELV